MKNLIFIAVLVMLFSCSSSKQTGKTKLLNNQTFLLTEVSTDKTYGLSEKNPIEVGGDDKREGPLNERRFLNALAGPNGEQVSYYRRGSCCPVKSKNGFMGMAMLDNYRVTWEGSKDTVSIYINMYDYGELKAPVGFTIKPATNVVGSPAKLNHEASTVSLRVGLVRHFTSIGLSGGKCTEPQNLRLESRNKPG